MAYPLARTIAPRRDLILSVAGIAIFILLVFWPVSRYPFLTAWDDDVSVVANDTVRAGVTPEAALAVKPYEPAILFARGAALVGLDRIAEAAADFRRVLELDPGNAEARAALDHALRIMGRQRQ